MLYIFEMANNHQGSIDHAFRITEEFSKISKKHSLNAGVKLQFRQLDTFIHSDFKNSDLKYVKRFNSTRLSKEQFSKIVKKIKDSGLVAIATPFDNESLEWINDLDVDIIKIASCSIDDWPLLRSVCKINKRVIISTAGASFETLDRVYNLFKKNMRDFSFMHCVGEYPTPIEASNLNRITLLRERYADIEIGISTHESPDQKSIVPYAVSMGCKIIEKHVGVETDTISLNAYSCNPAQMASLVSDVKQIQSAMTGLSERQSEALGNLKRGIYAKSDIPKGKKITAKDLYYAMPIQPGQASVANIDQVLDQRLDRDILKSRPVSLDACISEKSLDTMNDIKERSVSLLNRAGIYIRDDEELEISAHMGLDKFYETGALIINKINREYCKKLILMQPGQNHPSHHHIKKEEAFELLYGDCCLVLNEKKVNLEHGRPVIIPRGVNHSFSSIQGCVIEEVSTTHHQGDSVYDDPDIFKLSTSERKFYIR